MSTSADLLHEIKNGFDHHIKSGLTADQAIENIVNLVSLSNQESARNQSVQNYGHSPEFLMHVVSQQIREGHDKIAPNDRQVVDEKKRVAQEAGISLNTGSGGLSLDSHPELAALKGLPIDSISVDWQNPEQSADQKAGMEQKNELKFSMYMKFKAENNVEHKKKLEMTIRPTPENKLAVTAPKLTALP